MRSLSRNKAASEEGRPMIMLTRLATLPAQRTGLCPGPVRGSAETGPCSKLDCKTEPESEIQNTSSGCPRCMLHLCSWISLLGFCLKVKPAKLLGRASQEESHVPSPWGVHSICQKLMTFREQSTAATAWPFSSLLWRIHQCSRGTSKMFCKGLVC